MKRPGARTGYVTAQAVVPTSVEEALEILQSEYTIQGHRNGRPAKGAKANISMTSH